MRVVLSRPLLLSPPPIRYRVKGSFSCWTNGGAPGAVVLLACSRTRRPGVMPKVIVVPSTQCLVPVAGQLNDLYASPAPHDFRTESFPWFSDSPDSTCCVHTIQSPARELLLQCTELRTETAQLTRAKISPGPPTAKAIISMQLPQKSSQYNQWE